MLSIERLNTAEAFASLHSEWNELLRRSASDCVFLTHEWLFTWWTHLSEGRTLHIVTVREEGRLVGILPAALRRPQIARMMPRVLEFLGSGAIGSDYLDVIVDPDRENEALDAMAHHLTTTGLMIQLSQLRRNACVADRLAARLRRRNWSVQDMKINVCPAIPLAGESWESYLATLSSNQRYNFQRKLRSLQRTEGYRFETNTGLDVVIDLHKRRWMARGGLSEAFQTDAIAAFHREFVEKARANGWLRLLSIWIQDRPAAALYGLHYGSTFYFYQSGFDTAFSKQSVGLVMMGLAIKTALEAGATEFDLLHGDEEYKFHWARQVRDLGRLELYPPHAGGTLYRHCVSFNRAARLIVKRMMALPNGALRKKSLLSQ